MGRKFVPHYACLSVYLEETVLFPELLPYILLNVS